MTTSAASIISASTSPAPLPNTAPAGAAARGIPGRIQRLVVIADLLADARRLGRQHVGWLGMVGIMRRLAADAGVEFTPELWRGCTSAWNEGWR